MKSEIRRRGAYTLAELLIVILIMVMLVSITLPTVKRVMEDGKVREASRQFNAYIAMAKARALQTGRPCGIMLRCDLPPGILEPAIPPPGTFPLWPLKQVTQMYLAEVPPPYSGSVVGSKGRIMASLSPTAPPGTIEFHPLFFNTGTGAFERDTAELAILGTLIEDGELFLVRFEYKGAWYRCQRVGSLLVYLNLTQAGSREPYPPGLNVAGSTMAGYDYQILRLPRRIGNPLELSAGTCIDLTYSGIGPANLPSQTIGFGMYPTNSAGAGVPPPGLFPGPPTAAPKLNYVTIMFQPDGGIESIFLNNYFFTPPTAVHFLVGRADKLNPPFPRSDASGITVGASGHATGLNMFDPNTSNLADPLSLWVSVARVTGNVNTSENAPPTTDLSATSSTSMSIITGSGQQTINPSNTGDQALYLALCRQNATNREQVRGK